jgi:hypothetical protein
MTGIDREQVAERIQNARRELMGYQCAAQEESHKITNL